MEQRCPSIRSRSPPSSRRKRRRRAERTTHVRVRRFDRNARDAGARRAARHDPRGFALRETRARPGHADRRARRGNRLSGARCRARLPGRRPLAHESHPRNRRCERARARSARRRQPRRQPRARSLGYYYAPDPSSQSVCSIGGNVAENAGGAHCLKYGFTVNHALGATLVLADGSVTEIGGPVLDCLGYDLMGPSSAAKACSASSPRFGCAAAPSRKNANDLATLRLPPGRRRGIGDRPRGSSGGVEMMTGSRSKRSFRNGRGLAARRRGRAADRRGRHRRRSRGDGHETIALMTACGAIEVRSPHDDEQRALMWKGARRVRRHGAHQSELLRARRRHPAQRDRRGAARDRRARSTSDCASRTSFTRRR